MHGTLFLALLAALLPPPVQVRPEPQGVTLDDPSFEPLAGARADFGRLGGSVYQIEVPARWNGRLVLFMHGFGEFAPSAGVSPPAIRRYLIGQGFAWGASSFSSTSLIPGRAADETAAVWDLFARRYGRPTRTYVTGQSMGGAATHVAAERYGNRFDGALGLCGAASQTPAARIDADFFVAAAYAAGVTQREYDRTSSIPELIRDRILPALRRPRVHRRFEDIMVSLTGGPRPFDREGFRMEEETNWHRAELLVGAGIARNRQTVYRLGPPSPVTSRRFNQRGHPAAHQRGPAARVPRRQRDARQAGDAALDHALDGRRSGADRPAAHPAAARPCRRAGPAARVARVHRPGALRLHGHRVGGGAPGARPLGRARRATQGQRQPAPERSASAGSSCSRVRAPRRRRRCPARAGAWWCAGDFRLDGARFDSRWLGAVVLEDGLVTPCQLTLPLVRRGRGSITVVANAEASGCGRPGARIALWTFAHGQIIFSRGHVALASRWRAERRTARSRARGRTGRPGPERSSAGRCSGRTGASSRAGRASRRTSARRAAAWRRCAARAASPASA